jgi:hypothetical protein
VLRVFSDTAAWPQLPEHIRAAILALVDSVKLGPETARERRSRSGATHGSQVASALLNAPANEFQLAKGIHSDVGRLERSEVAKGFVPATDYLQG